MIFPGYCIGCGYFLRYSLVKFKVDGAITYLLFQVVHAADGSFNLFVKRTDLLLRAAELQDRFGCIQTLSPLPMTLTSFRPTTGYDDVKMVAIGRLAAPNIGTIQVDWRRYGPKLAQVALTFGADDVEGISASDEAPEGRRRAPLEEIRRNIEAAGFEAIERTGRFAVLS